MIHPPTHDQEERGSTHWGSGINSANDTLTHPADIFQSKIKSVYIDGRRQKIFSADVLLRKYVQKFSDRRRHLKHSKFLWLIWKGQCKRDTVPHFGKQSVYH